MSRGFTRRVTAAALIWGYRFDRSTAVRGNVNLSRTEADAPRSGFDGGPFTRHPYDAELHARYRLRYSKAQVEVAWTGGVTHWFGH